MQTSTIRISESSRRVFREISRRDKKTMQAVLEQAIEAYRRQTFLEGLSEDFDALRENDPEWQREKEERATWDITLADNEALEATAYLLGSQIMRTDCLSPSLSWKKAKVP